MTRLPLAVLRAAAFAAALAASCGPALAWGDDGHMIVGSIAYKLLRADVRARVDAMLAADPDPLVAHDFVSETVWADRYRDAARDRGGSNGSEKWHFTNIELSDGNLDAACRNHPPLPAGTAASAGPAACAVDKVEQFTAELASPATAPAEKLLALKFLLHLVGDLHQPLHSADNHDGGGNGIYVVPDGNFLPVKLHAYWDTEVVHAMNPAAGAVRYAPKLVRGFADRAMLASVADGIEKEFAPYQAEWLKGRPADWALDAFTKARDVAYRVGPQTGTSRDGKPVYKIDAAYEQAAVATARQQLAKAGLRLAGLLNGALGQ